MASETSDPASWHWTAADKLFLTLVRRAHELGIRVVIDGVFNHTGRDFFAFEDIRRHQAASRYKDWYVDRVIRRSRYAAETSSVIVAGRASDRCRSSPMLLPATTSTPVPNNMCSTSLPAGWTPIGDGDPATASMAGVWT